MLKFYRFCFVLSNFCRRTYQLACPFASLVRCN
ncbi:MAG: hypothetical protein BECKG1743D_GA0114223_103881, partial [Candidatus Kentron sp. G]